MGYGLLLRQFGLISFYIIMLCELESNKNKMICVSGDKISFRILVVFTLIEMI